MKKILVVVSIVLLSSVAMAHDKTLGANPDLEGSSLLDHDSGDKAGRAVPKGEGDQYASVIENPEDQKADPNAKVEVWDGKKDKDPEGHEDHSQN